MRAAGFLMLVEMSWQIVVAYCEWRLQKWPPRIYQRACRGYVEFLGFYVDSWGCRDNKQENLGYGKWEIRGLFLGVVP